MARALYTLLFYLLTPLIWLRLLWRARRQREYLQHLGERSGVYPAFSGGPVIWVHAVSVGETRAAQPLVHALQARWPGHRIVLSGMTPTGRDAGRQVFGDSVLQVYLPYDLPFAVDRFFRHFSPDFGVLMETEIWPNLLASATRHRVPVYLANARLSERSARGYQRIAPLAKPAFAALAGVAAQTEGDAQRISLLGASPVQVCGNLKFDVSLSAELQSQGAAWREKIGGRPVWLAASTREGEEALLLEAWKQVRDPAALLVIVPRHPQRFEEVAALLAQAGHRFQRRSLGYPSVADEIWLGDSMGEMVAYYALADLAFIGGSLLPLGGQNLIEAAACACPVLVGPHTFNFKQATEDAIAAGAALRIADAGGLGEAVARLLADAQSRQSMRDAALQFSSAHRGATARMVALIALWSDPVAR